MAGAERMTIEEVVRKVLREEHGDVIRESVRLVAQELMEVEVCELIGAQRGERTEDRATHRNGYRPAAVGHQGRARSSCRSRRSVRAATSRASCSRASAPSRRWSRSCSRPMCAASRPGASISSWRAWGCGSARARSAGSPGCSTSRSQAFRERPLEGRYPYLFVDAKVEKVRDGGRVARKCVVIAHAVHETGRREIIGLDVGAAETEAFWREFLRSLVARGLVGVQLAISDAHPGLKAALAQVLGAPGSAAPCTSCAICAATSAATSTTPLGAIIRPIFTAADGEQARQRLRDAVAQLERRLPKIAALLEAGRARRAGLLRLPGRALAQDPLHQPAGTLQPRDRPAHRRRRDLPRRRVS